MKRVEKVVDVVFVTLFTVSALYATIQLAIGNFIEPALF
jgi:hypothetical protein